MIMIGKAPLKQSNKNTGKAYFKPNVRLTFEPTFLLPYCLISIPLNILE